MSPSEPNEIVTVLDRVNRWSPEKRIELVQGVLKGLAGELRPSGTRRPLSDLVGMLKVESGMPGDRECRDILEQEKLKKFGP